MLILITVAAPPKTHNQINGFIRHTLVYFDFRDQIVLPGGWEDFSQSLK